MQDTQAAPATALAKARWTRYAEECQPRLEDRQEAVEVEKSVQQLSRLINTDLLDFKHNDLLHLEKCLSTLLLVCSNVANNPEVDKFRRIRASNSNFQAVAAHLSAEKFLAVVGWRTEVEQFEKYWVYRHLEGSKEFREYKYISKPQGFCVKAAAAWGSRRTLHAGLKELQKALALIHAKEGTCKEDRKEAERQERERVLQSFHEDREDQKAKGRTVGVS